MTPSPDNDRRWRIMDKNNGWFDIGSSREGRAIIEVVATAYSLGAAEIVRDALMAAYGGKVYERPRQALKDLPCTECGASRQGYIDRTGAGLCRYCAGEAE